MPPPIAAISGLAITARPASAQARARPPARFCASSTAIAATLTTTAPLRTLATITGNCPPVPKAAAKKGMPI